MYSANWAFEAVAEVFLGGDDFDADDFELLFDEDGVVHVAEGAGEGVDEHGADVGVGVDVGQEFTEDGPLLQGLAGFAGFDELTDDGHLASGGFALAFRALGGDGEAVGVDVERGVGLAAGGDAEIDDGVGFVGGVGLLQAV